jgi:hypothetical protein
VVSEAEYNEYVDNNAEPPIPASMTTCTKRKRVDDLDVDQAIVEVGHELACMAPLARNLYNATTYSCAHTLDSSQSCVSLSLCELTRRVPPLEAD